MSLRASISFRKILRIYFQHLGRYPVLAWTIFFSLGFGQILNIVGPVYYKKFLDALTQTGSVSLSDRVDQGLHFLFVILFLHLAGWICWRTFGFVWVYLMPRVLADIDQSSFAYLHKHSYEFFSNSFAGSLVRKLSRFSRSFEELYDVFQETLFPFVITLIGIFYVLFRNNPVLALVLGVWTVFFLVINYLFSRWKLKYDIQRANKDSEVGGALADALTNNANIKLFTGYDFEQKKFTAVTEELRRERTFGWSLGTVSDSVQGLLMTIVELAALYIGLKLWKQGRFTIGDFVLLQSYLLILFNQLDGIRKVIRRMYESFADASDMAEILTTPHHIRDKKNAKLLRVTKGAIRFSHVTFTYPSEQTVLNNFDLTIQPKEKVALIGSSGAGKSTVIKLLFRFYDLNKGKILIDGQAVNGATQDSLREHVALVPQDPILFHRSLLENIRYGKRDATDEEVIESAKKAHAHDFISQTPQGYQTLVGERGIKLSGGERQRVAIARAILKNAPILVLDEATSSLDSESEALIQDALRALMKNKTTIVIAHRLSTIMQMDRIVVMEKGRVIDSGTHEQLLEKTGIYQKLWQIQAGGFKE